MGRWAVDPGLCWALLQRWGFTKHEWRSSNIKLISATNWRGRSDALAILGTWEGDRNCLFLLGRMEGGSMAQVPRMRWGSAGTDEWWGTNAFWECMNIEYILRFRGRFVEGLKLIFNSGFCCDWTSWLSVGHCPHSHRKTSKIAS